MAKTKRRVTTTIASLRSSTNSSQPTMFKLMIQDDEGKTTVVPLIRDEITIGRKEGNTIRLTERNISRRHARIIRNNGEVHIEDLGSYNGIRVNSARIAERVSLRVSDQVQIGDYKLYLKAEGLEQVDESHTQLHDRMESTVSATERKIDRVAKKTDPTRDPRSPPFLVGTHLRCIDGHDAYVPRVKRPRDIKTHPEDWARISGRGIEVTIDRVELGRRGTGHQLRDEDGPMFHEDGEPMLDETKDGYSVYHVVRGTGHTAKMSGRCIDPSSAHRWQILAPSHETSLVVRSGDFIKEGLELGLVLVSGAKTFDVVWIGGSTTRYHHGVRDVRIISTAELDEHTREHLTQEAEAARSERRAGAQIRRGTVSPRR
jgi:hypothetical protein